MDSNYLKQSVGHAVTAAITDLIMHGHANTSPSLSINPNENKYSTSQDPVTFIARYLLNYTELSQKKNLDEIAISKQKLLIENIKIQEKLLKDANERQDASINPKVTESKDIRDFKVDSNSKLDSEPSVAIDSAANPSDNAINSVDDADKAQAETPALNSTDDTNNAVAEALADLPIESVASEVEKVLADNIVTSDAVVADASEPADAAPTEAIPSDSVPNENIAAESAPSEPVPTEVSTTDANIVESTPTEASVALEPETEASDSVAKSEDPEQTIPSESNPEVTAEEPKE